MCKITCRVRLLCSIAPANNWRFIPQKPIRKWTFDIPDTVFLRANLLISTRFSMWDGYIRMQNLVQGPATRIVGQHSPELQMRPSAVFHVYMNDSVDLTVFCIFMYFHISYLNKFDYKRWFTYLKCGISSLPSTKGHFPALKAKIESNIWKSNCKLHRRLGERKHMKTRSTYHHTWFKLSATPQNASLSVKQIKFRGLLRGSLRRAGEHRGIYRSQVNIWYVWQYFTPFKLYYFSMQGGWIHPKTKLGTRPRNKNWESTFLSH